MGVSPFPILEDEKRGHSLGLEPVLIQSLLAAAAWARVEKAAE